MVNENESRIGQSMTITGIVESRGRVVLEGMLGGSFIGGALEIRETGKFSGDISAQLIDCAGRLEGNISTDALILRKTGYHVGTAETRTLRVDPGAVLDCVLQSGTLRGNKDLDKPTSEATQPAVRLRQVLTAFREGRPCCMDIPWSARHELLNHLLDLLEKGKPLVKVTGEKGSGKSVLVEKLRQSLPERFEVLTITDQVGAVAVLLQGVAADLGIKDFEHDSQTDLLARIMAVLEEKRGLGQRVVLLVDDAQEMYPATMEGIIRLLTNAYGEGREMLQMVLFGTREMEAKMVSTTIGYFEDETNCQLYLEPMTIKDTADYLRFCLQLAAADKASVSVSLFPFETIRTLHVLSRGNLAEINRLADAALQAAHAAGAAEVYSDFL